MFQLYIAPQVASSMLAMEPKARPLLPTTWVSFIGLCVGSWALSFSSLALVCYQSRCLELSWWLAAKGVRLWRPKLTPVEGRDEENADRATRLL